MGLLDSTRIFATSLGSSAASDAYTLYLRDGLDVSLVGTKPSVCAIGAFDGVHLGHRALISAAVAEAQTSNMVSLAVLFDPDPACVLTPEAQPCSLLSIQDRIRMLLSLGLDGVVAISFTKEFSQLTYIDFLEKYLNDALFCKSIHVGENFRMGVGGKGTVYTLGSAAKERDIELHAHELFEAIGAPVSATRIRSLLRAGKAEPAAMLLERPHMVRGTVEHGRGQGTSFGFPTANIHTEFGACLPAEGVYAGWVGTGDHMWPAAINVGAPRTFGGMVGTPLLEATLLGFEGDLYGSNLVACFHSWLRGPKRFGTLEKLESTVLGNIDWVRQNIGEGEVSD